MGKLSRDDRSPRVVAGRADDDARPVDKFVQRLALPLRPNFDDLSRSVEALYGRPLKFREIRGDGLHATTGIVFDAPTFTGVMVPAEDSKYYSLLSRVHELCHLIIRSAPDEWFSPELPRPAPAQGSRLFLPICPRSSSESVDPETVREERIVEQMARSLMRRLRIFADSPEEDHFA
jgi:hypothetical protein